MKKLLLLFGALALCHLASSQTYRYYLPKKLLKVSVTFTEITKSRIKKSTTDDFNKVVKSEVTVLIKDPITIEEVVLPDLTQPIELNLPGLDKKGASAEYTLQWQNGIASNFNATRESMTVSIISGTVGLVSTAVSAATKAIGIGAGPPSEYSEVVEEKKIQLMTMVDVNCKDGSIEIKLPDNYLPGQSKPTVTIAYTKVASDDKSADKIGEGSVTFKSIIPAYYQVTATVKGNGGLPDQTIINSEIAIPQCGKVITYQFDLMKGKRTVAFEMNPATGQLTKISYKKESSWKASQEAIQSSITQLSQSIADLRNQQDQKKFKDVDDEIEKLKKENARLQELKTKADLEKALGGTN